MTQSRSQIFNLLVTLQGDASNPQLLFSLGKALCENGQNAAAEPHLRKLVAVKPDHHMGRLQLASCLDNQGKRKEAEPYFRETIAAFPEFFLPHFHLGICLSNQERYPEAIEALKEALRLEPLCVQAMQTLAVLCKKQGDLAGALAYTEQLFKLAVDLSVSRPDLLETANKLLTTVLKPLPPDGTQALSL